MSLSREESRLLQDISNERTLREELLACLPEPRVALEKIRQMKHLYSSETRKLQRIQGKEKISGPKALLNCLSCANVDHRFEDSLVSGEIERYIGNNGVIQQSIRSNSGFQAALSSTLLYFELMRMDTKKCEEIIAGNSVSSPRRSHHSVNGSPLRSPIKSQDQAMKESLIEKQNSLNSLYKLENELNSLLQRLKRGKYDREVVESVLADENRRKTAERKKLSLSLAKSKENIEFLKKRVHNLERELHHYDHKRVTISTA